MTTNKQPDAPQKPRDSLPSSRGCHGISGTLGPRWPSTLIKENALVPRVLGLAGFVLFLPLSSTHSCGGDNVKVTLVVILASEEGNKIDKRLATIADEIRKHEPKLKSFHLKSMTTKSLAPGEKMPFALIEDKNALVVIKHGADKENRVSLAVTAPNQAEIV